MRLAAQAKGGFYPTPPRVLDLLATLLRPPARLPARYHGAVRLLDPCCGAGAALAQLATRLRHCTRYLAEHGLLVFIVPRRRLPVSARFLAAHYRRLQCAGACRSPPVSSPPTTGGSSAGPSPTRSGQPSTRSCLPAAGAPSPSPTRPPSSSSTSGRKGNCGRSPRRPPRATPSRPPRPATCCSAPARSIPWRPPRRPGGAGCGPRPPSPTRSGRRRRRARGRCGRCGRGRGHLAMLVAAGFLDNLCLEANGQRAAPAGQGPHGQGSARKNSEKSSWANRPTSKRKPRGTTACR